MTNANAKLDNQATELGNSIASLESQNLELTHRCASTQNCCELGLDYTVLVAHMHMINALTSYVQRASKTTEPQMCCHNVCVCSVKELSSEVSVLKRDVAKLEKKNENAERANEKLAEAKEDLKKEIKTVQVCVFT